MRCLLLLLRELARLSFNACTHPLVYHHVLFMYDLF